jgi:uncharacterized membrane protein
MDLNNGNTVFLLIIGAVVCLVLWIFKFIAYRELKRNPDNLDAYSTVRVVAIVWLVIDVVFIGYVIRPFHFSQVVPMAITLVLTISTIAAAICYLRARRLSRY